MKVTLSRSARAVARILHGAQDAERILFPDA